MIISANDIFVGLVYSNSSPFIEKIQAFENFFTRRIDLYDKVRFPYSKATSPPLCVVFLNHVFEVLVINRGWSQTALIQIPALPLSCSVDFGVLLMFFVP